MNEPRIKRALISVSDKLGLADFAKGLIEAGVEIYSTGGTAAHLEGEGIRVQDVAAYTGFPEMMDGRLKTLHPAVFGGILCRHDRPDDLAAIDEHGIVSFELVVVNLYPFEATVARADVTLAEAIEKIDIGGPSLVRAAAKNHTFVTISTLPEQYSEILEEITQHGGTTPELRQTLAASAFARTAAYDRAIQEYFDSLDSDTTFASTLNFSLRRKTILRYGENPHQEAALYSSTGTVSANLVAARQLNGKELSYNNFLDLDSALSIVRDLPRAGAVVIKHNNPCGAASADTLSKACQKALEGDPVSAFGSVLGLNRVVDVDTANLLSEPGLFVEAIVAPSFDPQAVEILTTRPKWKNNVRLMHVGQLGDAPSSRHLRQIDGGMLVQDADVMADSEDEWRVVTEQSPTDGQLADLRFAWNMVGHVKSNAIVLVRDEALLGVGAGQMSRVDSVEIAIAKAAGGAEESADVERAAGEVSGVENSFFGDPKPKTGGSVMGSDAFFPFADSIHRAARAGITAVIQPGGSRRDEEVIAACNEHGVPMVFTGRRHFKH